MTVTAKTLIQSKQASNSATTEYTAPTSTKAVIHRFTATNTTAGAITLTIHIVPSGSAVGASNMVLSALSIAANTTTDITQIQDHVLDAGDSIAVLASAATSITIRCSGREIA